MSPATGDPQRDGPRPAPTLLSVAEVAALVRVPMVTVYRLINAGALPAVRVGRSVRVSVEDASALLRGRGGSDR